MSENRGNASDDISFKKLFVPLTTIEVIHYIVIVGLIVFFNSLFNPFIADDTAQIIQNHFVHSITNFPIFFTGGTFLAGDSLTGIYYKPLLTTVFSGIYSVFGPTPFFFHLTQLLFHMLNSILVYVLFSKFLTKYISLFLALIFLVHPINSESVIYISNMQEPLFFIFGISGLHMYLRDKISVRFAVIAQSFFLLSMLSKETGVLFLIITFLYIIFFKRTLIKTYIIFSLCTITIYSILRFFIAQIYFNQDIISPIMSATFVERLLTIPSIYLYYITTFFFPKTLLLSQQWIIKSADPASFYVPLAIDILVVLLMISVIIMVLKISRKVDKAVYLFTVWLVIGLLLHSQIFPLDVTISDRWFYFPIVGLLGLLGIIFETFYNKLNLPNKTPIFIILILVVVLLLSVRTIVRNSNWADPVTLYSHDISNMRPNFSLENSLAAKYLNSNQLPLALSHAKRSVDLYPTFANLTTLGIIYTRMGDIRNGKIFFKKAIQKGENYLLAYQNLAGIYAFYESPKTADKEIGNFITRFPNISKLYIYRAIAAYRGDEKEDAKKYAQKACQLSYDQECLYLLQRIASNLPIEINK